MAQVCQYALRLFNSQRSGRLVVAQQSVQWTVGILRHFRALPTPEQNPALGVLSHPAPPPLTQTVGRQDISRASHSTKKG